MNYIAYNFEVQIVTSKTIGLQQVIEILIAQLGLAGFESFVEKDNGAIAYIQEKDWHPQILSEVDILSSPEVKISYQKEEIEQVNWNSEWEKNFDPIVVDQLVSIRAPFHENPYLKYDIIIEPKMSFGTGHHETTHLMIQQLLDLNVTDFDVLDMGCGTGILAIFSEMKGAKEIDAIDIDPWCFENSVENVEKNSCEKIKVLEGDISLVKNNEKNYDLILANINRNVLLQDMAIYSQHLSKNGTLLLSGFYFQDIAIIDEEARKHKLILQKTLKKNNWVSLKYVI